MFQLTTERLGLRNMTEGDLAFVKALREDAICARFQRWEDTSTEHIRELIDTHRDDILFSEQEIQRFLVVLKDFTPIGTFTLFFTPEEDCITLGITIAPTYQRKGYAKELLATICHQAKTLYPSLDLIALIHPENTASVALFESLGFHLELHAQSINSLVYVR